MKRRFGVFRLPVFLLTAAVSAYGLDPDIRDRRLSERDFLVHVERAERGSSAEEWERILREDLASAPGWEGPELLGEFGRRFGAWLEGRAAERLPAPGLGSFLREIGAADLAYIAETDESGALVHDEAGDPVFKGAEDYAEDEGAWRARLEARMNGLLEAWELEAKAEFQELLAPLSGDLAALGRDRLAASLADYRAETRREFDRLYRAEKIRFAAARLTDSYSLRKKAEDRSAAGTARSLAAEAEDDLAEAKRSLIVGAAADPSGKPGLVLLDPETWQEDFRREFERGIETWNEAERRLLTERLAWETGARNAYVGAEASWDRAFAEFSEKRDSWFAEMGGLVEAGREGWEISERKILEDYETSMTVMAAAAAAELSKFRDEAGSYAGLYRSALGFAEMAEENEAVVLGEIARIEARRDVLDSEIATFRAEVAAKEVRVSGLLAETPYDALEILVLDDAVYHLPVYSSLGSPAYKKMSKFYKYLADKGYELREWWVGEETVTIFACGDLAKAVEGFNRDVLHAAEIEELFGAIGGIVFGELDPRIAEREEIAGTRLPELREDLAYWTGPAGVKAKYLAEAEKARSALYGLEARLSEYGAGTVEADSLDREIGRLEAELTMRNEQVAIARAVLDYANDVSSSRPTEAETARSLAEARAAFDSAEAAYRSAVAALDLHVAAMARSREDLSAAGDRLASANAALEEARTAYGDALNVLRLSDVAILDAIISSYGEDIEEYYGESGRAKEWKEYLSAWDSWLRAAAATQAREIAEDLRGEGDFDDYPDLPALAAKRDALAAVGLDWTEREGEAELALRLAAAGVPVRDASEIAALYEAAFAGGGYGKARTEAALGRIAAAAALEVERFSALEALMRAGPLSAAEGKAFLAAAEKAGRDAEAGLLLEKARLELDALGVLRDGPQGAGGAAAGLAELLRERFGPEVPGSEERAALLRKAIPVLESILDGTAGIEEASQDEDFRTCLASGWPRGEDGEDLRDYFCRERIAAAARAVAVEELYEAYGRTAPCLLALYRECDAEALREAFAAADLSSLDGMRDFLESASRVEGLPTPVREILVRRIALKARQAGIPLPSGGGEAAEEGGLASVLADRSLGPLEKAGAAFEAGLSGCRPFLLAEAKAYVASRRTAEMTAGEKDGAYLAEALAIAGLDAGTLSVGDLGAFVPDYTELACGYVGILDGDRKAYLEAVFRPEDAFAAALLLARTSGARGDGEAFAVLEAAYLEAAAGEAREMEAAALAARNASAMLAEASAFASAGSRTNDDAVFYRGLFDRALAVYGAEAASGAASFADAKKERSEVLSGEKGILKILAAKAGLEAEREVFRADREAYEATVLGAKKAAFDAAGADLWRAEESYAAAAEVFGLGSERYGELAAAAEAAKAVYGAARYELRKAEDVREYAAGGCTPRGFEPEAVLERRLAERERTAEVLGMLREIRAREERPFSDRADGEYADLEAVKAARLKSLQYLARADEVVGAEAGKLRGDLAAAVADMRDAAERLFTFRGPGTETGGLAFTVDEEALASASLSAFGTSDPGAFKALVEACFAGGAAEAGKRMSAYAVLWAVELEKTGRAEELLRLFGLACYYEAEIRGGLPVDGAPEISVPLFGNQAWRKLVADYAGLGPKEIPVYGDDGTVAGYEISYPESRRTVEDFLANETAKVYDALAADGNLFALYGFFKMMIATDNVKNGASFIGKDVGDFVFDHADDAAMHRQEYCSRWWRPWLNSEGRRIKELRRETAAARDSGEGEREDLAAAVADLAAGNRARTAAEEGIDSVLGGGAELGASDFLALLAAKTGSPPDAELARIVNLVHPALDPARKKDTLSLLEAVKEAVRSRAEDASSRAKRRAEALASERLADYRAYRALLAAADFDGAAVLRAAEELYGDPSFTAEEAAALSLASVKSVAGLTRRGEEEKLSALTDALEGSFRCRLDSAQEEAREGLLGELAAFRERRADWEARVRALFGTGVEEWKKGTVDLYGRRKRWEEEYAKEYGEKNSLWEAKYAILLDGRDEWTRMSADLAVRAGVEGVARDFGLETERLVAETESLRIADMGADRAGFERLVAGCFDGKLMRDLVDEAGRLALRGADDRPVVAARLPEARDTSGAMKAADAFARGVGDEIYRKASLVAALGMREALDRAEAGVKENVDSANRSVEKNLSDTFKAGGYARKGSVFERKVVIDETVFGGIERERQTVDAFRRFVAPVFDHGADLSRGNLEGMSGEYIRAMVMKAQENLSKYLELVFGRKAGEDGAIDRDWRGIECVKAAFEAAEGAYRASAGWGRRNDDGTFGNRDKDGLFAWHVGYAPVMDEENPERVKEAGYGELGRIMTQYLTNEARWGRGLASFDVAWYNRKLWDDDADNDGSSDGPFGAPTVRSATNIAVAIAATALTGGAGAGTFGMLMANAAINLADDAVFTMMDVGNGTTSLGEGMAGLGRQAGMSFGSAAFGYGMAEWGGSLGDLRGNAFADSALKGAETLSFNAASGAFGALRIDRNGLGFDADSFRNSALGRDSLAGCASAAAGAFATSVLSGWDLETSLGSRLDVVNREAVRNLNYAAGGLASAGLSYGLTGEAKVNLLDVRGTGVLEMNLGGGRPLFELGRGGTNLDLGTLSSALTSGLGDALAVTGWKLGGDRGNASLEAINMMASAGGLPNLVASRLLFDGSLEIRAERLAENEYGKYTVSDPSSVVVNEDLFVNDRDSAAKLAAVLSHEATHAFGNRVEAFAYGAAANAYAEIVRNFGLEGDEGFAAAIAEAAFDPANLAPSGGAAEYMKLVVAGGGALLLDEGARNELRVVVDGKEVAVMKGEGKNAQGAYSTTNSIGIFFGIGTNGANGNQAVVNAFGGWTGTGFGNESLTLTPEQLSYFASRYGLSETLTGPALRRETGRSFGDLVADAARSIKDTAVGLAESLASFFGFGEKAPDAAAALPAAFSEARNDGKLSQELVQDALGMKPRTACAVTSFAHMSNEYFRACLGSGMDNETLLRVLDKARNTYILDGSGRPVPVFDSDGYVNSYETIGRYLAEEAGADRYLAWSRSFESLAALKAAGYESYMTKYTNLGDPTRTHFTSTSYGNRYEPYTEHVKNWWDNTIKTQAVFIGYKPTRYGSHY